MRVLAHAHAHNMLEKKVIQGKRAEETVENRAKVRVETSLFVYDM
jgi:hypothetical protein